MDETYAVIGAGPSGLAAARNLQMHAIPWAGYELADDVGGLWNIDSPRSTVYESAHLISSKTIARALGKGTLPIPEPLLRLALAVASRAGLSPYGPEQTRFLEFRPVLDNSRLKETFGYTPTRTSREAFEAWRVRPRGQ